MKAVRMHKKGGPEELIYEDAPKPAPGTGDALVRVYACAITPYELSWSATYTTRDGGDRLPSIPGHELSGVVETVAPDVTDVMPGDAVYALTDFWRDGAAADYVVVRAGDLAPKPTNLTHTQAAAVPLSALTAWQALFDHADLSTGQRVLIHGAGGGVGTYAVQLARWRGAHVIGTARQNDTPFLRELGADEVIDYTAVRFEEKVRDLDVVLDTVGGDTLERSWQVLRPGGVLVTIAGERSRGQGVPVWRTRRGLHREAEPRAVDRDRASYRSWRRFALLWKPPSLSNKHARRLSAGSAGTIAASWCCESSSEMS